MKLAIPPRYDELLQAVREHEEYVTGETLATSLVLDGAGGDDSAAEIEGRSLSIGVARA